jgi:hypothetical protein
MSVVSGSDHLRVNGCRVSAFLSPLRRVCDSAGDARFNYSPADASPAKIRPLAALAILVLLVAVGLLIAFAGNPKLMPSITQFPGSGLPDPRR